MKAAQGQDSVTEVLTKPMVGVKEIKANWLKDATPSLYITYLLNSLDYAESLIMVKVIKSHSLSLKESKSFFYVSELIWENG